MKVFLESVLLFVGAMAFLWRREIHLLSYFQQEEYDRSRFLPWCRSRRAFDRRGALVVVPAALLMFVAWPNENGMLVVAALGAAALLLMARGEVDPRIAGKKKFVVTQRATRILNTSIGLSAAAVLGVLLLARLASERYAPSLAWLLVGVVFQLAPAFLMLATLLLGPGERRTQATFYAEAKQILESVHPYTIGITGSYGKTSTKHILGTLLSADGPTFRTPKSINTVMGVTREIRQKMKRFHKYAIMEMGAYGPGSIRRLCEFTPPDAAIITAVGVMHMERFGTPERIYEAKSELAQAVPPKGILVCNGDNPGARRMATEFRKATTLLYGFDGDDLDCKMTDIVVTKEGTRFVLTWKGEAYEGMTKLFGQPMLSNLMASFTMAAALGVHPEVLLALARDITPAENRLQVLSGGPVTWIHDAYNSNPAGFAAALEVLSQCEGSRRIVMTPGMVELGDSQYEDNRKAAEAAVRVSDLLIVIGETNREALMAGAKSAGASESAVQWYARRDDAFAALGKDQRQGDIILIENDLPDLYETKVVL